MCQMTGLRNAQIAGKTPFLGVSVRVSSKEIKIWISRQIKKIALSNASRHHPVQLKAWPKQKGKGRANSFSLFELRYPSFPAAIIQLIQFSGFWNQVKIYILRLSTQIELHHQLSWLSSLQVIDHRTSLPS